MYPQSTYLFLTDISALPNKCHISISPSLAMRSRVSEQYHILEKQERNFLFLITDLFRKYWIHIYEYPRTISFPPVRI